MISEGLGLAFERWQKTELYEQPAFSTPGSQCALPSHLTQGHEASSTPNESNLSGPKLVYILT